MKQQSPFTIQIELTEGCNLMCDFCGIKGIREKAGCYKFLSLDNAKTIAANIEQTGWNSKIEFAMHGEPTANPLHREIFAAFANVKNQLMITTNGFKLVRNAKKKMEFLLFGLGINVIAIDDYQHNPFSKKILDQLSREDLAYHHYPREKKYSPHNRYEINDHHIIFVEDISKAKKGTHAKLNNHCGCASLPRRAPMMKRCAKPFRELSIRWDGNIAICCNDFVGWYKCGNALEEPLQKIWNNRYFNACRKILYNNSRDFTPCKWCDAISYRVGFLPDKMGKKSLPEPSRATYSIAQRATAGEPLAMPVHREFFEPQSNSGLLTWFDLKEE